MNTPQSQLNSLKAFVHAFAARESDLAELRLERDRAAFRVLFAGFSGMHRLYEHHQAQVASHYNLFSVLRMGHLEEKLHTPFLVHLLRSGETHGQGDLFYRSFVETMLPKKGQEWASRSAGVWVEEEKHTGGLGRIDVLIHNPRPPGFAIVIENKIYAKDQDEQLARYYQYARDILRLPDDSIRLIYLSPWGGSPTEKSMALEEQKRLKDSGVLHLLSYHGDVIPWLEGLLPRVQAPVVRETLLQYIRTLKTL